MGTARTVTVGGAAAILGISTERVRQLIHEGKLDAQRIVPHGWWKVSLASIERLKNSSRP